VAPGGVVKRTEIALLGAPSTGALRLELSGCEGEEGLALELLHDDRQTGTLARVLAGRVGLGEVSVPVAVKLQRDIALSQDDRGLRCSRCHRQFWSTPKTRDAILEATLRRDPACRGCAFEHNADPDSCLHSAVFLNFFRNRVLLLERLDLDLEDYLRWRREPG